MIIARDIGKITSKINTKVAEKSLRDTKTTNTQGAIRKEKLLENSIIIHHRSTIKGNCLIRQLKKNTENKENIEMIDNNLAIKDRRNNIPKNRRTIERISDIKTTLITRTATRLKKILQNIDNSPETKII